MFSAEASPASAPEPHQIGLCLSSYPNATKNPSPKAYIEKFGVLCQTADDFLVHQYHLCPQLVLDKLDDQGAGISQNREYVIASLRIAAPQFAQLAEAHSL